LSEASPVTGGLVFHIVPDRPSAVPRKASEGPANREADGAPPDSSGKHQRGKTKPGKTKPGKTKPGKARGKQRSRPK
jgi:hypothetical protein